MHEYVYTFLHGKQNPLSLVKEWHR